MMVMLRPGVTSEWETPQALFDELDAEFHFTLDPCATPHNAKCGKYYTKDDDGLSQDWTGETVFMNPPYGREIVPWLAKAASSKSLTVALIPVRSDTKWWHEYILGRDIRFLKGRLKFGGHKDSAPFPSAIVIFRET